MFYLIEIEVQARNMQHVVLKGAANAQGLIP